MTPILYSFLSVFAGAVIIAIFTRRLPGLERRTIMRVLLVGLVLRISAATVFAVVPDTRRFHDDAHGYETAAMYVARDWKGEGPEYRHRPINYGYTYFSGALCFIFGQVRIVPSLVNCILGVLAAFYIFLIARRFFHFDVAAMACKLAAFFPSMILWSAVAAKDAVMHLLILMVVYHVIVLRSRFTLWNALVVSLSLVMVFTVRFYLMYILCFAILASFLLTGGALSAVSVGRQLALVTLFGIAVVAFGMDSEARSGIDHISYERAVKARHALSDTASSGIEEDSEASKPRAIMLIPLGLLYLLFSPFPWQYTSFRAAMTLPEMLVWWYMTPFWIMGVYHVVKERYREFSMIVIYSVSLLLAYSVFHGNLGVMFRQRTQVFVFLFIFLAYGYHRKKAVRQGKDPSFLVSGVGADSSRVLNPKLTPQENP